MAYEGLAWPAEPSSTDLIDGSTTYNMGIRFHSNAGGSCVGVRWRVPDSTSTPAGGTHVVSVWRVTGETLLASKAFTPTPGGYQDVLFDTPITLTAGDNYVAAVRTMHYVFRASGGIWPTSPSGDIVSDESRLTSTGDPLTYPASAGASWFYVSPLLEVAGEPGVVEPNGLGIGVALGAPSVGIVGVAPDGLSIPLTFGQPATVDGEAPAPAASGGGGWNGLVNIFAEQREMAREDRDADPVECFFDGEPLSEGPNGEIYCRFCGDRPR